MDIKGQYKMIPHVSTKSHQFIGYLQVDCSPVVGYRIFQEDFWGLRKGDDEASWPLGNEGSFIPNIP